MRLYKTKALVAFLDSERIFYTIETREGLEIIVVDPEVDKNSCFDLGVKFGRLQERSSK